MKKIGLALTTLALDLWLIGPLLTVLHAQNSPAELLEGEREASQARHHPRHHSNRDRSDEYWEADERCYADNEC